MAEHSPHARQDRGRGGVRLASPTAYDQWSGTGWRRYAFTVEQAAIERAAGRLDGLRVLDAGCGTGRFTAALERRTARLADVDLDPAMLAVAARRVRAPLLAATGAVAPVITMSTNYEQQLMAATPKAGSTRGPTTPPPSTRSGCWPRWRAASARCSARGWRRSPRCSRRCCPAITCWSPGSCTGGCASGWPSSRLTWGLDVQFTDTTDLGAVAAAIRPGRTRLLWTETSANPMWEVTDLAAVWELAHAAGVRVAADNTVATPVLTRPFEHGADLVVHSASKYLNGHGDVLAGAVLSARRDPLWERIRSWRRNAGAMPGPFDAWLLQRGMRTLFLRVNRASQTALAIATHFAGHPALKARSPRRGTGRVLRDIPVIEPAGDGSRRRSCAGGGSHVRQLGRRPPAPVDMAGCLAATRSWQQRGRPRSGARERSVIALGIRSQGASGEARP